MSDTKRCHRLKSLSVVGGFLDGMNIDFADGLNCLIGARGTGKTTVLEFIRYALDAMPADGPARKRVEALVEGNLAGGRIEVAIQNRDGLAYIVSRSAGEAPVVLDANRAPTEINLRSGGLFNVDIFSQNEVEAVADEAGSQLSLIDNFQAGQIAAIDHRIRSLVADLDSNASKIIPLRQKIETVTEALRALPDVTEQLKAYTEEGGDDAQAINQAHELKALRDRERRAAEAIQSRLGEVYRSVETSVGRIDSQLAATISDEMLSGPNGKLIAELRDGIQGCREDVDRLLQQAMDRIEAEGRHVVELTGKLDLVHKQQDMGFHGLIEKHKEAQGKAAERARLERVRNDLKAKEREKAQLAEQMQALSEERTQLLQTLSELRDQRYELRKGIVGQINAALSPSIRVSLMQYGDPRQYQQLLEETLRGNRLQHAVVARKIVSALSPVDLAEVIKQRDAQTLVDKAELNPDQADKVIAALTGSRALFDLETVELIDRPKIELNDNGTFKETAELSTGQKCTTILPILLLDSENPLLIDQPEDNLDNRFVFESIVGTIGAIKRKRQLIFVTHNPNIPVLGEADRVFVMDSDGTTARRVNCGSVDDCKENIVTLLEGGADAFRRRGQRYAS
ncbi:MAG: AAA family ATPase [Sedimentisphaerales bacterium]|nr:AAA family ATPase [Sedimentisphaerales bacterium]